MTTDSHNADPDDKIYYWLVDDLNNKLGPFETLDDVAAEMKKIEEYDDETWEIREGTSRGVHQ